MKLIIGNKAYSSWSFRTWFLFKGFNIPFEEEVVEMYTPHFKAYTASLTGVPKVPILIDGDVTLWESLAIYEYIHETTPVWPKGKQARAHARAISNEMHAGFGALRELCTQNLRRTPKVLSLPDNVKADVARIDALWCEARKKFGQKGPYLYGQFSAADAMYAPVVGRFHVYGVPVSETAKAYMQTMMAHPAWKEWVDAAHKETWFHDFYERG